MKKSYTKTGIALIAAGLVLFAIAFIASGFDLSKLGSSRFETNAHAVNETFSDIEIHTDQSRIEFKPSEDGKVSVVCFEFEKEKHSVSVENGTLKITMNDERKWYERWNFFAFRSPSITVYLPSAAYGSLLIDASTGDIAVPEDYAFVSAEIKVSTGDVTYGASASDNVRIRTSTGDIAVRGISAHNLDLTVSTGRIDASAVNCGKLSATVSTGKTRLTDVRCESLVSKGSTGSITLRDVLAEDAVAIERSTGDVTFENSDAATIRVKTSTGDVEGTLRSDKIFAVKTTTGSVDVPQAGTGGSCEIETSTGDIRLKIAAGR